MQRIAIAFWWLSIQLLGTTKPVKIHSNGIKEPDTEIT